MIEKILNYIENHPFVNTIVSGIGGIVGKYIYDKSNNKDKLDKLKIKILRDCEDYTLASHAIKQNMLKKFAETIGDFQQRGFISSNLFSNAINNLKKEIEIEVINSWTVIKRGKENFDMEKDLLKSCDYFSDLELETLDKAEKEYKKLLGTLDACINEAKHITSPLAASLITS